MFFIGLQFLGNEVAKPTNWQDFNKNLLQNRKVDKIVIVNKEKAFIYIKKEFLSEEQFKNVNKKLIGESTNYGPHYYFEIGSIETFNDNLKEAQTEFDEDEKISPLPFI